MPVERLILSKIEGWQLVTVLKMNSFKYLVQIHSYLLDCFQILETALFPDFLSKVSFKQQTYIHQVTKFQHKVTAYHQYYLLVKSTNFNSQILLETIPAFCQTKTFFTFWTAQPRFFYTESILAYLPYEHASVHVCHI